MFGARDRARVASWHRWLGLALTIPLGGWVISAAVMMLVTMNAQNGLAGVYALNPYNSTDVRLDEATVAPATVLRKLSTEHGIDRVYWMRLQSRGPHLWYIVKPTPYALAMVFDARTGQRLDPLSDDRLAVVAGEALAGGRVSAVEAATEYNRYYEVDRLDVVRASIVGNQPATLIISRDEGRTLRRLNGESERFNWWYRTFHVNQFTDHVLLWSTLLYVCAAGVGLLAVFGYLLFWWRRPRNAAAPRVTSVRVSAQRFRNLHRTLGAVAGGVLALQLLVGAYLWLCLGPLEDPFRGKASFSTDWNAGFSSAVSLTEPGAVLTRVSSSLPASPRPIQAVEWRRMGNEDVWVVTTRMDETPRVFSAVDGAPRDALDPVVAGEIARQEVVGKPTFTYAGTAPQLWMDLNRPVPTYRFRFNDPGQTDVFVAQNTGQVIQRRPFFWRMFGPFLAVHMFEFTGIKSLDLALLSAFQLAVLGMILTGWRLQFTGSPREREPEVLAPSFETHP